MEGGGRGAANQPPMLQHFAGNPSYRPVPFLRGATFPWETGGSELLESVCSGGKSGGRRAATSGNAVNPAHQKWRMEVRRSCEDAREPKHGGKCLF